MRRVDRPPRAADELHALDGDGFVVLPALLDAAALAAARAAFERLVGAKERGTRHAATAAAPLDEPALDFAFGTPRVLAAVRHVIGAPLELLVYGARDPRPGYGAQGLHADWTPRAARDPYAVATAIWMLDDFTAANGATRVVPGSHRMPGPVPRRFAQPAAGHPDERVVVGAAGSALVFNGHLWHRGGENASDGPRRALQVQYVARRLAPPGAGVGALPARVPAAVRAAFDGEDA